MTLTGEQAENFMQLAVDHADKSMRAGHGGPFGACIVQNNTAVAVAANTVIRDNDPTAHAEINAIRAACQKLDRYWLEDCILLTTCHPCPMCHAAILWARIGEIYTGCPPQQATATGFADETIETQQITTHANTNLHACQFLMAAYQTLPNTQPY